MIDMVILCEARENAINRGHEIFVVRDPDADRGTPHAYMAFIVREEPRLAEALLSRSTRAKALADAKEWQRRKENPVRCCGREIPAFEPAYCWRCGTDYR